jgi:hypothetical protein
MRRTLRQIRDVKTSSTPTSGRSRVHNRTAGAGS